jgi:hypothetical protein
MTSNTVLIVLFLAKKKKRKKKENICLKELQLMNWKKNTGKRWNREAEINKRNIFN